MVKFAFVPKKKYYNKDKFVVVTDEKAIRDIASICSHPKNEKGVQIRSSIFVYNRELELVNEGEYIFLVSKNHPYLNKTLYEKELTKLIDTILKKENKVQFTYMVYNDLKRYFKQTPKSTTEAREVFYKVPYLTLKEAFEAASNFNNLSD